VFPGRPVSTAAARPNSDQTQVHVRIPAEHDSKVVVRYVLELTGCPRFRNMETLRCSGDKVAAVDVYFGRTIEQD